MRRGLLLAVLSACLFGARAAAGSPDAGGDLYLLAIALNQVGGVPGGWAQVGPGGDWKGVRAAAAWKGRLYSAEADGTLRVTDLATGRRTPVGRPDFAGTACLFASGDRLYTIAGDGSLYRVNPAGGTRDRVGPAGAWRAVRAGVTHRGRLYSAEADGTLQATDLATGRRAPIGKADFGRTAFLLASGESLYGIEKEGSLYRVNPADGTRDRLGPAGAWKAVRAAGVLKGKLYSAENDGTLRATDLATGRRTQVGAAEFGQTTFLLPSGAELCTIETSGNLYRVFVEPSDHVNDYNCFPHEVEKVFREQGRPFYRTLHCRKVLGVGATLPGVMDGLAWLRQSATARDRVVLYLTCHGGTDPREGWSAATADARPLRGRDLKRELGRLPCPAIALIETCGSGGFASSHENDPPLPPNVAALCACTAEQSVNNELDIALAEALYGRADFNRDGVIDLDEVLRYVGLRYREWWPDPGAGGAVAPVLLKGKAVPGSLTLTRAARNLGAVAVNGSFYSALLERQTGTGYQLHLLGWSSTPGPYFLTRSAPRDSLCLPGDGPPLLVEQKGAWYPARLVRREGDGYRVHYLGYNEEEAVTADRIRHAFAGEPGERFPAPASASADWAQVGPAGGWKAVLAGAVRDDRLYTAETDGRLYAADLRTGKRTPVGHADFAGTAFLFAAGEALYGIEKDGSLYRINQADGSRSAVGRPGDWKDTLAGAVLGGRLYTAEAGGGLYVTDPEAGRWKALGRPDFGNTAFLFASGETLYSIEKDGSLYRISPTDGSWLAVGRPGDWKDTLAGAVLGSRLYTVETNGVLWRTDLRSGAWSAAGKPEYGGTVFMFPAAGKLFTIEKDGNLYRVNVR